MDKCSMCPFGGFRGNASRIPAFDMASNQKGPVFASLFAVPVVLSLENSYRITCIATNSSAIEVTIGTAVVCPPFLSNIIYRKGERSTALFTHLDSNATTLPP